MTRRFLFRPPPSRFAESSKQAAEPDEVVLTDKDGAAASAQWDRDCSPEFRGLLEAESSETD